MKFIGVDGCRAGWFCVIKSEHTWEHAIYPDITELCAAHADAERIFIDMPIGLPSSTARECDVQARKLLSPRRSMSVFPVPCREAVHATDYPTACELNLQQLGRKLSKQSWNICRKIAELDRFLLDKPGWQTRIFESHPELCFYQFNRLQAMSAGKKTLQGREQRRACIKKHAPACHKLFEDAITNYQRKDLLADDILDAMILAVSASQPADWIHTVPTAPARDETGLPMQISYALANA